jgi:hypothetical protein
MWIRLIDGLRQHVQRPFHRLGVPAGRRLGYVEERVVDLVWRRGLAQRQNAVGAQRICAARLDLHVAPAQDRIGADGRAALRADLGPAERIADDDPVAVDPHRTDLADIDAGDADLVAGVDAAGVGELGVVGRRRKQHRHAGEALSYAKNEE